MPEDRGPLRGISWPELFPWTSVLPRAFRLAVASRVLVLAALGLVAAAAGNRLIGYVLSGDDQVAARMDQYRWPWELAGEYSPFVRWPPSLAALDPFTSPLFGEWNRLSEPVRQFFMPPRVEENPLQLSVSLIVYWILTALWTIAVWALVGGAITRIAAVAFAREDRLGIRPALRHALGKWRSYFAAPLFPLIAVLLAAVPVALIGLLLRANAGTLVAAIFWPLVLIAGLFMTIMLVGLLFGWPLMWATISVERTDSFDALSRSYAYVYQRPLHYLFYSLVAGVIGILGWLVAQLFFHGVVEFSVLAASWGSGGARMREVLLTPALHTPETSTTLVWGAGAIGVLNAFVYLLGSAFLTSFFWTSATGIYFLLRRAVDATELDDVSIDEPETPYGLPPLTTDAAGVPSAADQSAASTAPPTGASPAAG